MINETPVSIGDSKTDVVKKFEFNEWVSPGRGESLLNSSYLEICLLKVVVGIAGVASFILETKKRPENRWRESLDHDSQGFRFIESILELFTISFVNKNE